MCASVCLITHIEELFEVANLVTLVEKLVGKFFKKCHVSVYFPSFQVGEFLVQIG